MKGSKLTAAQALALLKAAGVQVAEIVTDETQASPDFNPDNALADIDKARTVIIRPQIEGEIKDSIAKSTTGAVSGSFKSALARGFKASGITRNELDAFENMDDMVTAIITKHNSTFSKDTEDLRTQLTNMATSHGDALKKLKEEHAKTLQIEQDKFIDREIDELLAVEVKAIPRTGGSEIAQARQLKKDIREKYNIHFDPILKKLSLRSKDNPELPVYNETKTAQLEIKDLANSFLTDLGVVVKDNRHQSPGNAMQQHFQQNQQQVQQQQQFNNNIDPVEAANKAMLAELSE